MKRRLLNALTALSLMLCAAVCLLWVRGAGIGDTILLKAERPEGTNWASRYWQAYAHAGRVRICRGAEVWTDPRDVATLWKPGPPSRLQWSSFAPGASPGPAVRFERVALANTTGYSHVRWELTLPDWFLIAAAAALPAARLVRRVHRGPIYGGGRCPRCGYDLRATPDKCPECGTAMGAG
jgi:hypothetical protein